MSLNKRIAHLSLSELLQTDDALLLLMKEANDTQDESYLRDFEDHLKQVEDTLADLIFWSKRLKDDVQAARGRSLRREGRV